MSIYKNKYRVEKELYSCFQKEIFFSRKIAAIAPVIAVKKIEKTIVETAAIPVI